MMPKGQALGRAGLQKIDDETQPPQECFVEIVLAVRRENRETVKLLHSLQEVIDFNVGESVVSVFHLSTLSEERVCLVKEQQDVRSLARIKNLLQPLLGLSYVFVDDARKIHAIKFQVQRARQHLCGHRFPGAARTCK